jgi:flagellar basal-body rod protein FlgB
VSDLLGDAAQALADQLRFRVARQAVLASNIAHADTPGYRASDLTFEAALEQAAGLARTDPRHLAPAGTPGGGYALERGPRGTRPDRNGVDLDQELIRMSRNAGSYSDQASLLARLIALRMAAVRGEP